MLKDAPIRIMKSKASLTVDIQTNGCSVSNGIMTISDTAINILESEAPFKHQRRLLATVAEYLLQLQTSVVKQISDLVPEDCTKYSIARLHLANNYTTTNQSSVITLCGLPLRTFNVNGTDIPCP